MTARYAFHDLLRVYAADLVRAQEPDPARHAAVHRLLDHHLHTAHAARSLLPAQHPPIPLADPQPGVTVEPLAGAGAAREWFIAESAALAALVGLASQSGFDPYVWRLALMFTDVLDEQGHWQDWLTVMHAAVAAAGRAGDLREEARANRSLARAFTRLTRWGEAHTSLERALQLHRAAGDEVGLADTLLTLAFLCDRQGRYRDALGHARQVEDRAVDCYEQALALLRGVGDRPFEASALARLGDVHEAAGDHPAAREAWSGALAILRDLGHPDAGRVGARLRRPRTPLTAMTS